jgi:hypothetical protein
MRQNLPISLSGSVAAPLESCSTRASHSPRWRGCSMWTSAPSRAWRPAWRPKMEIICDGAPGQIRPGIPRGWGVCADDRKQCRVANTRIVRCAQGADRSGAPRHTPVSSLYTLANDEPTVSNGGPTARTSITSSAGRLADQRCEIGRRSQRRGQLQFVFQARAHRSTPVDLVKAGEHRRSC